MGQVNITMGKATVAKLDALKEQYGSRSQVVAVAVHQLWMMESMPESQDEREGNMSADELWDRFAPDADPVQLAQMSIDAIVTQVHELRKQEPDQIGLTDRYIAWELRDFAAGLPTDTSNQMGGAKDA